MTTALPLVIALLAAPAAGPAPAIAAEPATLSLGTGARATLRVVAPEPPRIVASDGRVEAVRAAGDGVYEAEYVPPRETWPRIALVAALAGGRCGWTAIPLVGSGEAVVRTDAGAKIQVTIGEQAFGPVRADERGIALVPVIVPPGVRHAIHRGQKIDLRVPDVAHVAVVADAGPLRADRDEVVAVHAFAVTSDGRPRPGAPVAIAASAGDVSAPAEVAPGVFTARWRLPAGAAGTATLTATLHGDGPAATAQVLRDAGPATKVRVVVERAALAPSDRPPRVRAELLDAAGNPAGDDAVATASFGAVTGWARVAPGAWEGLLDVPRARGDRDALAVRVRGGAAVEGEAVVALVPGAPVALALDPAGGSLEARRRATTLLVSPVDAFGNPVDLGAPEATAAAGALSAPTPLARRYALAYRAPRAAGATEETITVRAGGLERVARFELVPPSRDLDVSARAGYGLASGGIRGPAAGVELAALALVRRFHLGAGLDASVLSTSWSTHGDAAGRALRVSGGERALALQAVAVGRMPLGPGAVGLSAGGGLAQVATELQVEDQPRAAATGWVPAATAALSYRLRAGPGLALVEVRAQRLFEPRDGPVRGSLDLLTGSLGYAFHLL